MNDKLRNAVYEGLKAVYRDHLRAAMGQRPLWVARFRVDRTEEEKRQQFEWGAGRWLRDARYLRRRMMIHTLVRS